MIIRVQLQLKTTIHQLSYWFVHGGVPTVRANTLSDFTFNTGVPRRRSLELPARRVRFYGFVPRFRYRLHRKFYHKLRKNLMPFTQRLNSRTSQKEMRRWVVVSTLRYRRWRKLFQVFTWPKKQAGYTVNRAVHTRGKNLIRHIARYPTVPLGDFVKDYDWTVPARHRRGDRAVTVYQYTRNGGIKPRWCAPFHSCATANNVTRRRDFVRPCSGLLALRPVTTGERLQTLHARHQRLQRSIRQTRVFKRRAQRLVRHTKWYFRKLAKAVSRPTKRHLRLQKKRVRRRIVFPFRQKKIFRRTTRSGLHRLHLHRPHLLEVNQMMYPQRQPYLEMKLQILRELAEHKVTTTLEYNKFEELPYDLDMQRKKTNHKRYKPRDHPVWGEILTQANTSYYTWLKQSLVLKLAHKHRIDPKRRDPRYNEINNPTAHPQQSGPWSYLFWSTVPWGRGSYWRTKPVNRAKRVFIDSVCSGFLSEKESRNPTTAGLLASTVRSSTLAENNLFQMSAKVIQVYHQAVEFYCTSLPGKLPPPPPLPVVDLNHHSLDHGNNVFVNTTTVKADTQPTDTYVSVLWRRLVNLVNYGHRANTRQKRQLLVSAWPHLVACYKKRQHRTWYLRNAVHFAGWNVYGVYCALKQTLKNTYTLIKNVVFSPFWLVRYLIKKGWRYLRTVFRFVVNVKTLLSEEWQIFLRRTFFQKRAWRRFRWAYHAWTHVYVSDDFADEMLNPEVDVEVGNWVENDEDDQAVDYGEELESEGTYWNALNPEEWDGYWNHDIEDYFDESREIMGDLLFEEIPYYVKLCLQPVTDLIVRLPVWGLLEGLSIGVIWLKREWQLLWIKQLLKGGPLTVVLIVLRRLLHAALWVVVYATLVNLVSPDELNLFITYSCGMVFYDEYYVLWWSLCFGLTVWLIGPHPLREYLFRELGPENIAFVTLAGVVLCTPEEYYTQRPLSDLQRLYQDRTLGHWSWKPFRRFPTQHHYRGGHGSTYPIYTYDTIQQTIANFNDMQDWPEIDFTDKDPTLWLSPDRSENEWNLPGWPLTDESSENFFWHRHPVYYRNNYMEMVRRDQLWEHDCFEPYFRDELDDSPRNEAIYHQVNTRCHSGQLVNYPTVTKPEYLPRSFD